MTLISTIISDAFRESNLVAVGAAPTTAEQTEALRLLNRLVQGLYGNELGVPLQPLPFGEANVDTPEYINTSMEDFAGGYVPYNTRLMCNLQSTKTVNLPPVPRNGARFAVIDVTENFATYPLIIEGNGRQVEGGTSLTLSTNGVNRQWFYRDDLGEWVRVSDLLTTDESPFPSEFDDLLIVGLAIRLSSRMGKPIDVMSTMAYSQALSKFLARYRQTSEKASEDALLFLPSTYYYRGTYSSTERFNRGY